MVKINVTLESAELLDRLAYYAELACEIYGQNLDWSCEKDEEDAYALAKQIREEPNG